MNFCGKILGKDQFTNIQIAGCFFPWVMRYSINLYLIMYTFQYLESHLAYISCCYVGQTWGKLSDCQGQHFLGGLMKPISKLNNFRRAAKILFRITALVPTFL